MSRNPAPNLRQLAGCRWDERCCGTGGYTRKKTGVAIVVALAESLRIALAALPRHHLCILTTAYGKPFTVDGFSSRMRDAIKAAGITDLSCRPHGLRKTLGRLMADAECTAHEIMAAVTRHLPRRSVIRGKQTAVVAVDARSPSWSIPRVIARRTKVPKPLLIVWEK